MRSSISVVFVIIFFVFFFVLFRLCIIAFQDVSPYGSINSAIAAMFGNFADMSGILGFITAVTVLPMTVVYQLSRRCFWLKDDNLFFQAKLLGAVNFKCRIPFERILEIKITRTGPKQQSVYDLSVKYEKKLPLPFRTILHLWGRQFTQWNLTLAAAVTDLPGVKEIQETILTEISKAGYHTG